MKTFNNNTTEVDQRLAKNSLDDLMVISREMKDLRSEEVKIKIQETDNFISIPKKAFLFLYNILQNMAKGKSISVITSDAELSTQQAADLLSISRPHLIKLLDSEHIPYRKVGNHRRILLQDVISYESKIKKRREKQLKFLSIQAQDLNLGYE